MFSRSRLIACALTLAAALPAAALRAETVYNSIPSIPPYNQASIGFEATQTREFGDDVTLAGSSRSLSSVSVMFSDWAIKSTYFDNAGNLKAGFSPTAVVTDAGNTGFFVPITVNVYSVNNAGPTPLTGSLLGTVTSSTFIPWRPESDPASPDGQAYLAPDGNYYHGSLSTGTYDFSSLNITLPNEVIVGVAYNTFSEGYTPTGLSGPYDSLNVATNPGASSVGTDVNTDAVFWNTTTPGNYTDGGTAGVGIFRQDTAWTGEAPAFSITATPEPASMGVLALGGLALMARRRKQS